MNAPVKHLLKLARISTLFIYSDFIIYWELNIILRLYIWMNFYSFIIYNVVYLKNMTIILFLLECALLYHFKMKIYDRPIFRTQSMRFRPVLIELWIDVVIYSQYHAVLLTHIQFARAYMIYVPKWREK